MLREDKERMINEAQGYRNAVIPEARGQAAKIVREAEGYRERVIKTAEGDASRFLKQYAWSIRKPQILPAKGFILKLWKKFYLPSKNSLWTIKRVTEFCLSCLLVEI